MANHVYTTNVHYSSFIIRLWKQGVSYDIIFHTVVKQCIVFGLLIKAGMQSIAYNKG